MSEHFMKEKNKVKNFTTVYTYWTTRDCEDEDGFPVLNLDDAEDVFSYPDAHAIKVEKGDRTQYWVKRGKYGQLFNPKGLYSENSLHKQERHAGRPLWRLQTTSKRVFDFYVQFLKTKNTAWLQNAEREI